MSTALLFTGQGSPTPGAGTPWRDRTEWALVDEVSGATGVDVGHLLLDAPEAELVDTANAQLATFTFCLLVHRAVAALGLPSVRAAAGHSLGEYTALVAAGVLSLPEGAALVATRGAAMRAACQQREGTMAAIIGIGVPDVETACRQVRDSGEEVWVANDNAPGQVVVAGSPSGVDAAAEAAKELGARRPMPLKVAGAFHTPLMGPAQEPLDAALDAAAARGAFVEPHLQPWANCDARRHDRPAEWRDLLSRQLCSPVRWREQVAAMAGDGVDTFVELGPGTVLSGTVKRIAPEAGRAAAATPEEVAALPAQLGGA